MPAERSYVPDMTAPALTTAEQLLHLNLPNKRTELVRGALVVREPAGGSHGRVAMNLAVELGIHIRQTHQGYLFAAETGFVLERDPDTVRAPDIAFVQRARWPQPEPVGFPELAPDLVAEVKSPGDRPGEVLVKVAAWLDAGVRLVWVIDPQQRAARAYRADGSETVIAAEGSLDGEDVLPGFACLLSEIL